MTRKFKQIKADAILWDFDGTLADSATKNIAITKKILARVAPRLTGENLPDSLQNKANYHVANHGAEHWRELYSDYFGMNEAEIGVAGPLWNTYQELDNTEVSLFSGVMEAVSGLAHFPMGICSANSTQNIVQVLEENGLASAFQSIIGYDNLEYHEQKPAAEGGLRCLQQIFGDTRERTIIYVGDHIADVLFARALSECLHVSNNVISVAVTYSGAIPGQWRQQPDIVIDHPPELVALFEDQA